MEPDTPSLGFFLKICCFLTGADPDLLRRCPARDKSNVATISLLMLLVWAWQTISFTVVAHVAVDETSQVRPEFIVVAALIATLVMLVDSYTVIRSSWFMAGLAQLKRGGLQMPGYLGTKIKNGLQYAFRLPLGGVLGVIGALAFEFLIFKTETDRKLYDNMVVQNAPLTQQTAVAYDAGSARLATRIVQLQTIQGKAQTDAGAYRLDVLQAPAADPELKPAAERARRAEAARLDAERRLARLPAHDSAERRAAVQRFGSRRAEAQEAQARLDKLRSNAEAAATRRRDGVQGRLDETVGAEQRYQTRLDELEKEHAARLAAREDSIRAAVERDPAYRPVDRGLLARARVLAELMEDPWVFAVAMLLHAGVFGIELGAVLCKALTSVPSSYAVALAGEEYAHDVETANAVFDRINSQAPLSAPYAEPEDVVPDAPRLDAGGSTASETPANDDETDDEGSGTAERLQEGARRAKAQAAARAKGREKPTKASEAPPPSLAESILDGPVRRSRGRPPGAKNRPKPDNDPGEPAGDNDAA